MLDHIGLRALLRVVSCSRRSLVNLSWIALPVGRSAAPVSKTKSLCRAEIRLAWEGIGDLLVLFWLDIPPKSEKQQLGIVLHGPLHPLLSRRSRGEEATRVRVVVVRIWTSTETASTW